MFQSRSAYFSLCYQYGNDMSAATFTFYKAETPEKYTYVDAGLKAKVTSYLDQLVATSLKYVAASSFKVKFTYNLATYTVVYYPVPPP